tara:strand:- start:45 stop:389 length:345 start_codon:yes stop_codon:yes gene_type:complete
MKIYHNTRCRKSRETLSILTENGCNIEVVEYLKTPLKKEEIKVILKKLDMIPEELIRKQEKLYKELYKDKVLTQSAYLDILVKHPILIQRPIVVKDNFAVLGRPPINVLDLLNK